MHRGEKFVLFTSWWKRRFNVCSKWKCVELFGVDFEYREALFWSFFGVHMGPFWGQCCTLTCLDHCVLFFFVCVCVCVYVCLVDFTVAEFPAASMPPRLIFVGIKTASDTGLHSADDNKKKSGRPGACFWLFNYLLILFILLTFCKRRNMGIANLHVSHFWTKIGPFLGDFGTIFGSSRGHLGIILVSFWHQFGSFWCRFRPILRPFWAILGHFSPKQQEKRKKRKKGWKKAVFCSFSLPLFLWALDARPARLGV